MFFTFVFTQFAGEGVIGLDYIKQTTRIGIQGYLLILKQL